MSARHAATRAARTAADSPVLHALARAGYAASGIVHLLIGSLAIRVALHDQVESDQAGAIAQVAQLPGGMILLWALVVGFFALAAWLIAESIPAIGSRFRSRFRSRWARSAESLGKAIAYLALGFTALTFALGSGSDASASTRQASTTIMQLPAGQLLLAAAGLIAAAVGAYLVSKGVRRTFLGDLVPLSGDARRRAVIVLGAAGYISKGIAVAIVGILFVVAAVTLDAGAASGLDGALKSLVAVPFGIVLLILIGVGLIAFGGYSFARARLARM